MSNKNNRVALVAGIVLFSLAAVITISLILGFLNFGNTQTQKFSFLLYCGTMLRSVYGVSSFLIPVYILVCGTFCLSSNWSRSRIVCVAISVIPFFTVAFAEHQCRVIALEDSSPIAITKIFILAVIALLLVAMEYLVAVVLATSSFNDEIKPRLNNYKTLLSSKVSKIKKSGVSAANAVKKSVQEKVSEFQDDGIDDDELFDENLKNEVSDVTKVQEPLSNEDEVISKDVERSIEAVADSLFTENENAPNKSEQETYEEENIPTEEFLQKNNLEENESEQNNFSQDKIIFEEENTSETDSEEVTSDETVFEEVTSNEITSNEVSSDEDDSILNEEEIEEEVSFVEDLTEKIIYEDDGVSSEELEMIGEQVEEENATALQEELTARQAVEEELKEKGFTKNDFEEESFNSSEAEENDEQKSFIKTDSLQRDVMMSNVNDVFAKMAEDAELQLDLSDKNNFYNAHNVSKQEKDWQFNPEAKPVLDQYGNRNDENISEEASSKNDFANKNDYLDSYGNKNNANISEEASSKDDFANKNDYLDSYGNKNNANIPDVASSKDDFAKEYENSDEEDFLAEEDSYVAESENKKHIEQKKNFNVPYKVSPELLTKYEDDPYWIVDDETNQSAENLKSTLSEFGIEAEVTGIRKGPVVTMFEILPAPGVKLSKIAGLQDNIALRLAASSVRIVAPIPGKEAVGIEIPNKKRSIVSFRECIERDIPAWKKMAVPVVLGKDIEGETQIMDLVKTPHLLIAGSTGSGKSVCVNSMILSILFKRSPSEVKMILIDPKIVELKLYNDIPHLLTPVITEPKRAMQALQYCLCEMERRYSLLDGMGVRDISSYNRRIIERRIAAEQLPYIIVVIDEFADLMATTGKQLESVLARLAAMSRAVGIHLVLATQRPSINVITGLIKANIPSRIAFMVASKTDSRIIIDQMGAEKLLGKGDMLYASSIDPFPIRIQGTFISGQEVEDVVEAVKKLGEPEYIDDEIFVDDDDEDSDQAMLDYNGEDPLYEKALDVVVQAGKASASYIQRRLKIGYNRAARLVEEMEERGIVGPANGSKPREIIHLP